MIRDATPQAPILADRESAVMRLLCSGQKPGAIAKALNMAPGTVSAHLDSVKEKLGALTTTHAAVLFDRQFQREVA